MAFSFGTFYTLGVALCWCLFHLRSQYRMQDQCCASLAVERRCDNDGRAADHVIRFPRPSPSIFAHCKRSRTGGVEGMGTRLARASEVMHYQPKLFLQPTGVSEHLDRRFNCVTELITLIFGPIPFINWIGTSWARLRKGNGLSLVSQLFQFQEMEYHLYSNATQDPIECKKL